MNKLTIGYVEDLEIKMTGTEYNDLIYGIEENLVDLVEGIMDGKLYVEGNSQTGFTVELAQDPEYNNYIKNILDEIQNSLGITIIPISKILRRKWNNENKKYYKKVESV